MEKMNVYLDNAATTKIAPEVVQAMMPYLTDFYGNPSSTHAFGRKTKTAIEQSRRTIAKWLNCSPSEIVFTSGGTEADNLALHAAVNDLACTHIITSPIEHSAVIKAAQDIAERKGITLSLVQLTSSGAVDLDHLRSLLQKPGRAFVTLMHGNNEIGNLLPLQEVSSLCEEYNAIFHSDTVQTMAHYAFDLQKLKIHFLNASAHKFHGPKGVGFIYINKDLKINPDIIGGGQERGLRGGTENLLGIVGMAKAIDLAYSHLEEHQNHIRDVKMHMIYLLQETMPEVIFNGQSASADSLYTVLSITLPPSPKSDMMLLLLDLEGIACSGGSACSSGAAKGSHVLDAIGALKKDCASVRFSFSRYTTMDEIDYTLAKLREMVVEKVPA